MGPRGRYNGLAPYQDEASFHGYPGARRHDRRGAAGYGGNGYCESLHPFAAFDPAFGLPLEGMPWPVSEDGEAHGEWGYGGLPPFPGMLPWGCGPELFDGYPLEGMPLPWLQDAFDEALDDKTATMVCEAICTALLEAVTEDAPAGGGKAASRSTAAAPAAATAATAATAAAELPEAAPEPAAAADSATDAEEPKGDQDSSSSTKAGGDSATDESADPASEERDDDALTLDGPGLTAAQLDARRRLKALAAHRRGFAPECEPGVTTAMLRNIPNKYTRDMLVEQLNLRFRGLFNFLYVPMDFQNKCNVGYAFINFISEDIYTDFVALFHGVPVVQCLPGLKSTKIVEVTPAKFHGLDSNVARLSTSSVMLQLVESPEWMPMIFDTDGAALPFPAAASGGVSWSGGAPKVKRKGSSASLGGVSTLSKGSQPWRSGRGADGYYRHTRGSRWYVY